MILTDPEVTRFTARLADRAQESRFRNYRVRTGARPAAIAMLAVLTINLIMFVTRAAVGEVGLTPTRLAVQAAGMTIGLMIAVVLWRKGRYGLIVAALICGTAMLTAMMAALAAMAGEQPFQGAIILMGGVAAVYFLLPLDLPTTVVLAVAYSAVTVPLWVAASSDSGRYTVLAVLLIHVVSLVETYRSNRERRILFAQREALVALSTIDPLTKLANRRTADVELAEAWRHWREEGVPISVIILDLDHFKELNDSQGHVAGDRALRLVADAIRRAMPPGPGSVAARYGGEEFCCVLVGAQAAEGVRVAERALAYVRELGVATGSATSITSFLTISAGVAPAGPGMLGPRDLVDAADRELYRAKREGRDRVRVAEPVVGATLAHT